MITEIAQIDVKPGTEKDFEAAVAKARPLFLRAKGGKGFELHKSIEKAPALPVDGEVGDAGKPHRRLPRFGGFWRLARPGRTVFCGSAGRRAYRNGRDHGGLGGYLGRGLIGAQPVVDERRIVCGEFVVPCRDTSTLLDLVEEPFDEISRSDPYPGDCRRRCRPHAGAPLIL